VNLKSEILCPLYMSTTVDTYDKRIYLRFADKIPYSLITVFNSLINLEIR
jgi:hypothetical protein